jgi:hypothetical protein
MKITLRLGPRRIAQRSLKLQVRSRRAFLVVPTRTVRRGDVLAIAVSGRADADFSGRWRVRV